MVAGRVWRSFFDCFIDQFPEMKKVSAQYKTGIQLQCPYLNMPIQVRSDVEQSDRGGVSAHLSGRSDSAQIQPGLLHAESFY